MRMTLLRFAGGIPRDDRQGGARPLAAPTNQCGEHARHPAVSGVVVSAVGRR